MSKTFASRWGRVVSAVMTGVAIPAAAQPRQPVAQTVSDIDRAASYAGWCSVCGRSAIFHDMARPIRETYQCEHCKASVRERVTASAILAAWGQGRVCSLAEIAQLPSFTRLAIYEPGIAGAYRKIFKPLPGYVNSFFWEGGVSGQEMNGVRHEDLMKLSFADETFDLVISSDIFEHIRRPWVAFSEIARVLKPNGMHIFSIPALRPMQEKTVYRVDTEGPEDVHIKEPYYHGDGRGGKSLVYTDFGADFYRHAGNVRLQNLGGFRRPHGQRAAKGGGIHQHQDLIAFRL